MADPKTQVVITAKDETAAGFASAGAALQRFGGQFSALANPIGAASVAMGAASAALVASVKSAIDTGDQLNKLSQKTGIAVESLSTLAYAGDLSGVAIDSLANGIKKLSVNMADAAASATGKAAEAFKDLGIEVKGSDGILRASDAVLGDIADRFAGMNDGARKTALAVALFGKAGADLIPLLNNGSKGLAEFKEEAEKLGLVMSAKTAKSAEEFNDNLRKLSLSASALGKSIADELLGPMAEYTRLVVEARKAGAGLFSSAVLGAQLSGADNKPLQELKDRSASLMGTISFLTQGGQTPNDPVFGTKLKNAQAELAVLQKIIAARMKAAQDFGPPVAPVAKTDTPVANTDGAKAAESAAKKLLADRERLIRLGQRNLAEGQDSEEEQRLLATARAQSEATKEFEALQRMLKRGEENELAAYYETAGEETMRLVAAQQALRKSGKDTFADLANAVESWGNKAADTFAEFVVTGKASFGDLVNSMLKDIVRLQAKQVLDPVTRGASNFLSGGIGKLFEGFFGGGGGGGGDVGGEWNFGVDQMPGFVPSFAGGGSTGNGARSGGLDGLGGFLAMMHPQEDVIDRSSGGSAGGAVTVILNISTGVAQTVRAEISNLLPAISASVQGAVMDARLRGGSTRAAYRG